MRQTQQAFNGVRWLIEGNIKGFLSSINHDVTITTLGRRIADERFLQSIHRLLNVDYTENQTFHRIYSGTPQGGIINSILANIHPDQLGCYMHEHIQRFDKGKERADNPECTKFGYGKRLVVLKLERIKNKEERKFIVREIKGYDKGGTVISCGVDMDENFRWPRYVCYTDDLLCTVIGMKTETEVIKQGIKIFLREKFVLELSGEKIPITYGRKSVKFFGYGIHV